MEVRKQRVRRQELKTWIDKQGRFASPGRNSTFMRSRFESADAGCTDRNAPLGTLNRFGRRLGNRPGFRMERVLFDRIVG